MNNIAETIKQAREARGLTQEDLAERCEVSRQAVSKWELGASVPTPEKLNILEEILDITFETEEGTAAPVGARSRNPWKTAATALGILMLAAVFSFGIYVSLMTRDSYTDVPRPLNPIIIGMDFFEEDGTPLDPDLGDGWKSFTVGQRVYLLVSFQNGTETDVNGVALYATPTGTETYDLREQLAVQAVRDRPFALFPLDFPEETMVHLDVTLECGGGQTVTETLNVTAVSVEEIGGQTYEWDHFVDASQDKSVTGEILASGSALPVNR